MIQLLLLLFQDRALQVLATLPSQVSLLVLRTLGYSTLSFSCERPHVPCWAVPRLDLVRAALLLFAFHCLSKRCVLFLSSSSIVWWGDLTPVVHHGRRGSLKYTENISRQRKKHLESQTELGTPLFMVENRLLLQT